MAKSAYMWKVYGLRSFQKALAEVGADLPESLRRFNIRAAEQVVKVARDKATRPQQHKAAESLRATKSMSYAAVKLGDNKRYAFARGAEWGAKQYKQFPPWRGNQWEGWEGGPGYFLHPAVREVGTTVIEEYWASIRALRSRAFPD